MARHKDWLKTLSKMVKETSEKTARVQAEVSKKRASRKKVVTDLEEDVSIAATVPRPPPSWGRMSMADAAKQKKTECRQTQDNRVNWYHVQGWFKKGILRNNPEWLLVKNKDDNEHDQTWWGWPEKRTAERMLKRYGAEQVEHTVGWMCDNWETMLYNIDKFHGAPNVRLLWASDWMFVESMKGKLKKLKRKSGDARKIHMVGEYDPKSTERMPDVGWGHEDDV